MERIRIIAGAIIFFSLVFSDLDVNAQCDITADVCSDHISSEYLSDGQNYRALLLDDQIAEFHATLFGGTTYRVAACSGLYDGNLIFRLYDKDRNLMFNNIDFQNAPYWDFELKSTVDCIIEAQLDPKAGASGCAVLLIGFKK